MLNTKICTKKISMDNISTLSQGSKILILPYCDNVHANDNYINNGSSYLYSTYKFFKNNGFTSYNNLNEFLDDFKKSNPNCKIRTFITIYKGLESCSRCPFYNYNGEYYYKSSEQKDEIEEVIVITFFKVFDNLKNTLNLNRINSLSGLGKYIKQSIKCKAHLNRIIAKYNVFTNIYFTELDNYQIKGSKNPTEECYFKMIIKNKVHSIIDDYLKGKDKLDTLIIINHLMKDGISYGNYSDSKWSLQRIANICGVTTRTAAYRKSRIIKELRQIYKEEIEPLLTE